MGEGYGPVLIGAGLSRGHLLPAFFIRGSRHGRRIGLLRVDRVFGGSMDFIRALIAAAVRVAIICLALIGISYVTAEDAQAQSCPGSTAPTSGSGCGDQGDAYAACIAHATAYTGAKSAACETVTTGPTWSYYTCRRSGSSTGCNGTAGQQFYYFPVAKTCTDRNNGQTINGVHYALNPTQQGWSPGTSAPTCYGGCRMAGSTQTVQQGGFPHARLTNRYYTGATCTRETPGGKPDDTGVEPLTPEPDPPEVEQDTCKSLPGGQTACMRSDGKHCASASTGATFCWNPNETGTQYDGTGQNAQTKQPRGNEVRAPSATIPSGNEWNRDPGHTTTVTHQGTTTNYNVTNWHQVPAGTGNNGGDGRDEPIEDGTPTPNPGEDDGGTATPATNCAETPQCAGKDAIGCAMLRQHHSLVCMEGSTTPNGVPEGDPESSVTEPVNSLFTGDPDSNGNGFNLLDLDGWASQGSCPIALTINDPFGGVHTLDETEICRLLDALAGLVLLLTGIHSGWILLSGSKR